MSKLNSKLDYSEIEKKWQKHWQENKINKTDNVFNDNKKKFYILDMFPYPSGEGLHVGHPKGYIATDVYSRMKKMQGYNVLHPMGWDAFGLPAEQFAIKNKINPNIATSKNVARYKEQIEMLGLNYDWDREINTTDPKYYKWTQWMWKQMYKDGLAYESFDPINWCPTCKTGLANEDLDGNTCERCGTIVEKKKLRQWTIRITDYADRLLNDLDKLNWEPHIKELQRNWIGKSEGSEIEFEVLSPALSKGKGEIPNKLKIFTTRADTLFGCTFMCISYTLAKEWIENGWDASDDIKKFIIKLEQEEKERTIDFDMSKLEKEGIDTGIKAINPANGEEVPIYIANYILSDYGTGAIMAVPAHDERDYEFAKKYNLEIIPVIFNNNLGKAKSIVFGLNETDLLNLDINILDKKEDEDGEFRYNIEIPFEKLEGFKNLIREKMRNDFWNEFNDNKGFYFIFKHKDGKIEEMYLNKNTNDLIDEYGYSFNDLQVIKPSKNVYQWNSWIKEGSFYRNLLIHPNEGVLVNSQDFDGMNSEEARVKITEKVGGKIVSKYKLKDWVFARQRYWGEPFPIVFDENRKSYAVADKDLPVILPNVENYEPTDNGESPLANIKDWVEVYGFINNDGEFESCDQNDPKARKFYRETNTMPQWAGSSWYYLRYIDPKNDEKFVDKELEKEWSPVDFYVGGAEHATRHLIYARFWHKYLFDKGYVNYDEPFNKLQTVGLIMAEDGKKMSKRYGNVVNPDDVIKEYGCDAMRTYEMFMGPFEKSIAWNTNSMAGVSRFLERVYSLAEKINLNEEVEDSKETERIINETIKKVGDDIEKFGFNTAIAQLMICLNTFEEEIKKGNSISKNTFIKFIQILSPFAVHISEEIWQDILGNKDSIHTSSWPGFDEEKIKKEEIEMSIQISGKMRGTLSVKLDSKDDEIKELVKITEIYKKYITDEAQIKKIIIVKNRLINIVI